MAALFLNDTLRQWVDRSPQLRNVRYRLEASAAATFWEVASWMPPKRASAFGRRVLGLAGPRLAKSKHVERNLRLAFPHLDDREVRELTREVWGTAGAVLAEIPHFKAICDRTYDDSFCRSINLDVEAYRAGRKFGIFMAAHLANWEITAASAAYLGYPMSVVHASSKNAYLERALSRRRGGLQCGLISRDEGARPLIRELSAGRSIGVVADARDDDGESLPFFGHEKMTTVAPARLALRFGCDFVPVRVERLGGIDFRITFCDPIKPDPRASSDRVRAVQMTTEVNQLFEQWIRERPQEWVCTKRAFPSESRRLEAGAEPEGARIQA